jgi:hypothetical protein
MRLAYLVGLGIGAALGTMWPFLVFALMGRTAIYRSGFNLSVWLPLLLLLCAVGGAVFAFIKFED